MSTYRSIISKMGKDADDVYRRHSEEYNVLVGERKGGNNDAEEFYESSESSSESSEQQQQTPQDENNFHQQKLHRKASKGGGMGLNTLRRKESRQHFFEHRQQQLAHVQEKLGMDADDENDSGGDANIFTTKPQHLNDTTPKEDGDRFAAVVESALLGKKGSRAQNPMLAALKAARDSMLTVQGQDTATTGVAVPPAVSVQKKNSDDGGGGLDKKHSLSRKKSTVITAGSSSNSNLARKPTVALLNAAEKTDVDISVEPMAMTSANIRDLTRDKTYRSKSKASLRSLTDMIKGKEEKQKKHTATSTASPGGYTYLSSPIGSSMSDGDDEFYEKDGDDHHNDADSSILSTANNDGLGSLMDGEHGAGGTKRTNSLLPPIFLNAKSKSESQSSIRRSVSFNNQQRLQAEAHATPRSQTSLDVRSAEGVAAATYSTPDGKKLISSLSSPAPSALAKRSSILQKKTAFATSPSPNPTTTDDGFKLPSLLDVMGSSKPTIAVPSSDGGKISVDGSPLVLPVNTADDFVNANFGTLLQSASKAHTKKRSGASVVAKWKREQERKAKSAASEEEGRHDDHHVELRSRSSSQVSSVATKHSGRLTKKKSHRRKSGYSTRKKQTNKALYGHFFSDDVYNDDDEELDDHDDDLADDSASSMGGGVHHMISGRQRRCSSVFTTIDSSRSSRSSGSSSHKAGGGSASKNVMLKARLVHRQDTKYIPHEADHHQHPGDPLGLFSNKHNASPQRQRSLSIVHVQHPNSPIHGGASSTEHDRNEGCEEKVVSPQASPSQRTTSSTIKQGSPSPGKVLTFAQHQETVQTTPSTSAAVAKVLNSPFSPGERTQEQQHKTIVRTAKKAAAAATASKLPNPDDMTYHPVRQGLKTPGGDLDNGIEADPRSRRHVSSNPRGGGGDGDVNHSSTSPQQSRLDRHRSIADNPYEDSTALPQLHALPDAKSILLRYENAKKDDEKQIAELKHMLTHPSIISEYEKKQQKKNAAQHENNDDDGSSARRRRGTMGVSSPGKSFIARTSISSTATAGSSSSQNGVGMPPTPADLRNFDDRFEDMVASRMKKCKLTDPHRRRASHDGEDIATDDVNVAEVVKEAQAIAEREAQRLDEFKLKRTVSGKTLDKARKMKMLQQKSTTTTTTATANSSSPTATTLTVQQNGEGGAGSARVKAIDAQLGLLVAQRNREKLEAAAKTRSKTPTKNGPPPKSPTKSAATPSKGGKRQTPTSTASRQSKDDDHRSNNSDSGSTSERRSSIVTDNSSFGDNSQATFTPTRRVASGTSTPAANKKPPSSHAKNKTQHLGGTSTTRKQQKRTGTRIIDGDHHHPTFVEGEKGGDESQEHHSIRRYKLTNIYRFHKKDEVKPEEPEEELVESTCEVQVWPPGIVEVLIDQFQKIDELHIGKVHLDQIYEFSEYFGWDLPPRKVLTFPIREHHCGIVDLNTYLSLMLPQVPSILIQETIVREGLKPAVERRFWTDSCQEPSNALSEMYKLYLQLRDDEDLRGVTFKAYLRHFRFSVGEEDLQRLFDAYDRDKDKHLNFYEFSSALWSGYSTAPFPANEVMTS